MTKSKYDKMWKRFIKFNHEIKEENKHVTSKSL